MATGTKKLLHLTGLRGARKAAELSLKDLEERTAARGQRVYTSTISELENGKRGANRSTAERLAGALGTPVGMLTGEMPLDAAMVAVGSASGSVSPVDVAAFAEFDGHAAQLAAAEGITHYEALGRMVHERMLKATEQRLLKPRLWSPEEMPRIAGPNNASAAVLADRR